MNRAMFPPLSNLALIRRRRTRISLTTSAGDVKVETIYGQEPESGVWLNVARVLWDLSSRQAISPVLEDRLCFTATVTGSYEAAASVARKWGVEADDSTICAHVQLAGARAARLREDRVRRALWTETRQDVVRESAENLPSAPFSLVIMMDGWMVRERGEQWGLKPREKKADRVEWREMKSAIFFRLDQRCQSQSGRRMIVEKHYEACRGGPDEFARVVYAEALRRGLNQARRVYVVADGGVWIWNIVEDRFSAAVGVLDFYHASEHLWAVARAMFEEEEQCRAWVEPLLHSLAHGGESGVVDSLESLQSLCASLDREPRQSVQRTIKYFQNHREHMHYQDVESQGCPKGSGAMESTCSQFQDRFKRTGQFWTLPGEKNLLMLELARRNDDWDEIWEQPMVA